jgi:hypothetical protein
MSTAGKRKDHHVSTLVAAVREAPDTVRAADAADTSLATCTGHRLSGRRSFRKQRTVNPLMVPARYNFLYSSSKASLRAATPRPARGAGLTLRAWWLMAARPSTCTNRPRSCHASANEDSAPAPGGEPG